MHQDHLPYFRFTGKYRIEQSLNTLSGLIEGISIDSEINQTELSFLDAWIKDHEQVADRHPYNELVPVVRQALSDRVLTIDEKEDVLWLCQQLQQGKFFDEVTSGLQELHAVMGGIASDGIITEEELRGLRIWLSEHEHLCGCWPYDEASSAITQVLRDGVIDDEERRFLGAFFAEFIAILDDRTITNPPVLEGGSIVGLCATDPVINFSGHTFCFTGASSRYTRKVLQETVSKLGGAIADGVSKKINYLVIGADGNPSWAYACYGRKVEKAVELRKSGTRLLIIHEHDFHDAVLDASIA